MDMIPILGLRRVIGTPLIGLIPHSREKVVTDLYGLELALPFFGFLSSELPTNLMFFTVEDNRQKGPRYPNWFL